MSEPLEPRALRSGNVLVTDTNGLIALTGDAADNAILVTQVKGGHLKIAGANGTTINGQAAFTTASVTQYVTVATGAGNDYVNLSKLTMPYSVKVDGGAGNDTIEFHNSTFGATDVYGQAGNDTIAFNNITQGKWLQVFAGDGKDTTGLKSLRARRGFSVSDSGTGGNTGFNNVSAAGQSWFTTGNGNDTFSIANSTFDAFSAKLRGGSDTAVVRGTTFNTYSPIDGGEGKNDINREVVLSWDFGNGDPQGWFVQLQGRDPSKWGTPVSQAEFAAAQSQQEVGSFGMKPISPLSGLTGSTLDVYFLNSFYLARGISAQDGLQPGTTYSVSVTSTLYHGGDLYKYYYAGVIPKYPDITSSQFTEGESADFFVGVRGGKSIYALGNAGTEDPDYGKLPTPGADVPFVKRSSRPTVMTTGSVGDAWVVWRADANSAPFNEDAAFRTFSVKMTPVKN